MIGPRSVTSLVRGVVVKIAAFSWNMNWRKFVANVDPFEKLWLIFFEFVMKDEDGMKIWKRILRR